MRGGLVVVLSKHKTNEMSFQVCHPLEEEEEEARDHQPAYGTWEKLGFKVGRWVEMVGMGGMGGMDDRSIDHSRSE